MEEALDLSFDRLLMIMMMMFRDILSAPTSTVKKSKSWTLDERPDMLSQNVGSELPLYAV